MDRYNKYNETLNIDCCNQKPRNKKNNNCCGGSSLPSHDNQIEILIMQLKREIKELMNTTTAKLLCQDKKISETMVYVKNNLSNSIRDLLNSMQYSGELDEIITDTITSEISELQAVVIYTNGFDKESVQKALSTNGDNPSHVFFMPGTYKLKGEIGLYSNTIIDCNFSTIIDCETIYNDNTRDGAGLRFINNQFTGGNGIENVTIKNGIFEGNTCGILFALLKGKNIKIENCSFNNCIMGTHVFDLCGCENVVIENCKFDGCSLPEELNYREIIQLDYASYSSFPYLGNCCLAFDDSACKNVTISNCIFEKGEGSTYPNAIGTHGVNAEQHSDVYILNNEFYDTTKACIRFPRVNNIHIEGNTFYNVDSNNSDKCCMLFENGRYNNDELTSNAIFIKNNSYVSQISNSNLLFLHIYCDPNKNLYHKNIEICDNIINAECTSIDNAVDFIQMGNIENVIVSKNILSKIKNALFYRNNFDVKNISVVDNRFADGRQFVRYFDTNTIENTNFNNNIVNGSIYEDKILFNGNIDSGTINLSEEINDFRYLICSTGGMDNQSYMTSIVYPFDINNGFRPNEDYYVIPGKNGNAVIQITGEKNINVISAVDSIRKIIGVRK